MDCLIDRNVSLHLDLTWRGLYFNGGFPVPRIFSNKFKILGKELIQAGVLCHEDRRNTVSFLLKTFDAAEMGASIFRVKFEAYEETLDMDLKEENDSDGDYDDYVEEDSDEDIESDTEEDEDSDEKGESEPDEDFSKDADEGTIQDSHDVTPRRCAKLYAVHIEEPIRYIDEHYLDFSVRIGGSVPSFQYERSDHLFPRQLWDSACNQENTDFELVVEGKKFAVHKFILAARSPVYAGRFASENQPFDQECPSQEKSQQMIGIESSTLEEFLIFIYTGHLVGALHRELLQLAEFYQIETLTKLGRLALPEIAPLPSRRSKGPETMTNAGELLMYQDKQYLFTITWVLPAKNQQPSPTTAEENFLLVSEGFGIDSVDETFSAKVTSEAEDSIFNISFMVNHPESAGVRILEVSCSFEDYNEVIDEEKMEPSTEKMSNSPHIFTIEAYQIPSKITFYVKFVEIFTSFSYAFRDTRLADDLWGAALNRKMTDVELFVESTTFAAHRFILSARSPVFYAMFNSAFEEAKSGKVRIEGVNADTFAQFLRFLYTGSLCDDQHPIKEELFALADKYDVKTLMDILDPSTENIEVEEEMPFDRRVMCTASSETLTLNELL